MCCVMWKWSTGNMDAADRNKLLVITILFLPTSSFVHISLLNPSVQAWLS